MTAQPELEEAAAKIVRVYHDAKSKRAIVGSIWLRDVPGALAAAASSLAQMGVNLVASSTSTVNGTGLAEWGFFAELEGHRVTVDSLNRALRSTPQVLRSELREGRGGLVVDDYHYPLKFTSGQQGMLVSRATFHGMLSDLRDVFGSGGSVIAYQLGFATGKQDADHLVSSLGEDRVLQNLPTLLSLYLAQGWGVPELVNLHIEPLGATVRLRDSFECMGLKGARPGSHFIRGHLAGLGSVFFGKKVECTEVRCVAIGDEYCEYLCVEA